MKITDIFKAASNIIGSGGSQGLVARNMACFFFCISHNEKGKLLSFDRQLFLSGCLSSLPYIKNGRIDPQYVADYVSFAKCGEIGDPPYALRLGFPDTDLDTFTNYVMNIEVLMFKEDNPRLSYGSVIQAVYGKQKSIRKMIEQTWKEGAGCQIYPSASSIVNDLFADEEAVRNFLQFMRED